MSFALGKSTPRMTKGHSLPKRNTFCPYKRTNSSIFLIFVKKIFFATNK